MCRKFKPGSWHQVKQRREIQLLDIEYKLALSQYQIWEEECDQRKRVKFPRNHLSVEMLIYWTGAFKFYLMRIFLDPGSGLHFSS